MDGSRAALLPRFPIPNFLWLRERRGFFASRPLRFTSSASSSSQYGSSSFRLSAPSPLLSRASVASRHSHTARVTTVFAYGFAIFLYAFFRRLFYFFFGVFLEELVSRMNVGCVAYFSERGDTQPNVNTTLLLLRQKSVVDSRGTSCARLYTRPRNRLVHFRRSSPPSSFSDIYD